MNKKKKPNVALSKGYFLEKKYTKHFIDWIITPGNALRLGCVTVVLFWISASIQTLPSFLKGLIFIVYPLLMVVCFVGHVKSMSKKLND